MKMIQSNCVFDKDRDLQEVDQFGYIDLVEAFRNGYVPGESEGQFDNYNDIEDPRSIVGKPSDCFEAMRMQDAILNDAKAKSKFGKASGKSANAVSANLSANADN